MKKSLLALGTVLWSFIVPCGAAAQERGREGGAAALGQLVAGLGVSVRVLVIGAHPDDEDTQLITWAAQGRHADVAYLSLTRGDGGQNLIGDELGEALGVIRTEELLSAREVDGGHQYFTRAYDFGFSKSAEETFRHWPRDSLLADVVTVVRAFRPHVIVSVFSGTPRDGHGQHQVSGMLARDAYDVASDSTRIPRAMTQGLAPWTPLKFYRAARFSPESATHRFNVGEYNPLLGRSYAEIAGESRSQHKSQAFGVLQQKGVRWDYVRREATRVRGDSHPKPERSIFDGIDTTWGRFRPLRGDGAWRSSLDSLSIAVADARSRLDLRNPSSAIGPLARIGRLLDRISPPVPVERPHTQAEADLARSAFDTRNRINEALRLALGVAVEATASRDALALGDSVEVTLTVYNRGQAMIVVAGPSIRGEPRRTAMDSVRLAPDSSRKWSIWLRGTEVSKPWWLATPRTGDLFVPRIGAIAEDERASDTFAELSFLADGALGTARVPVVRRFADPIRGEVQRPLAVVPAIAVTLDRTAEYAPASTLVARPVRVHLRSASSTARDVTVSLELPPGLAADSSNRTVTLAGGAARTVTFHVRGRLRAGRYQVRAFAMSGGQTFVAGYLPIEYDHIRPRKMYRPASIDLHVVDVRLPPRATVAYIRGVGDNVAPALEQLGIPVTLIDPATLEATNLAQFSTIVVGPRAYESHDALAAHNARLLEFVKNGGTLVMQYGQYEMMQPGILPYEIKINRPHTRVTVEDVPVRLVVPDHPLLTSPNRITARDFEGWVQERALYMPATFAKEWTSPIAMNDPGETPNEAAILVAPYGRGTYVYTTLAFFRQLPAGVPGAARLFVNLIGAQSGNRPRAKAAAP